jgi:Flp pilus assembly protein TadG
LRLHSARSRARCPAQLTATAADQGRLLSRGRRLSAQVIVEAAIVFPLLIAGALAVLQFGLYAHGQHVVTAAAQDSARVYAAQGNANQLYTQAQKRAQDLVSAGLGTSADAPQVTITPAPAAGAQPDHVDVTVATRMRTIIPWIPFHDAYLPLTATASMSKEHFRG